MTVVDEQEKLWIRYKVHKDAEAREELITSNLPMVRYVAGRLSMGLPSFVDTDDLISYGVFGLIDAVEKFEPSRGIKFSTYAVARIRGSILDGLRSYDWVPASVRAEAKEVESAVARLEARLGRSASDAEVAEELGIGRRELEQKLMRIGRSAVLSLDDIGLQIGRAPVVLADEEAPDPQLEAEFSQVRDLLAEAIDRLPEKERIVISLFYYEGLTVKEIGEVMGLSASRISQLHTKAIFRLRGHLGRRKKEIL